MTVRSAIASTGGQLPYSVHSCERDIVDGAHYR